MTITPTAGTRQLGSCRVSDTGWLLSAYGKIGNANTEPQPNGRTLLALAGKTGIANTTKLHPKGWSFFAYVRSHQWFVIARKEHSD